MSSNYQDLKVWKKSLDLTIAVYACTSDFPNYELHGLAHQMRRAVSVPSNIVEGKDRSTDRDFAYFLCHARGSWYELETQTLIARKLGYLSENDSAKLGRTLSGSWPDVERLD
jgi:four helix bundle protein